MADQILRYAGIVTLVIAAFLLTHAIASAPSREASRLGMRGLKRQRALQENAAWGSIEPLVRWLGVRVSGVMTDEQYAAMDKQLTLAGDFYGLTPSEYVALSIVSAVLGIGFGFAFAALTKMGGIIVFACIAFGAACPYLIISGEAQERMKRISRGLPYVIDLMALAMSAGLDFPGSIRQVVEKSSDPNDPLVEELAWMLKKMQLGNTRRQVLQDLALRAPVDTVREFVGAIVQADERGNPVAAVLQIQAATSRQRRTAQAEEGAAKAGVAMIGPLVLLFVCILLLIMAPIILRLGQNPIFGG